MTKNDDKRASPFTQRVNSRLNQQRADALALTLMHRRGFEINDYAQLHPAGTLGRKVLPVEDLMRVGTAALLGLVIALPATIGYMISGWDNPLLPVGSIGFVSLPGFLLISLTTVMFAPLGAKIAHALPRRQLSLLFGLFLLLVAVRMALRALA